MKSYFVFLFISTVASLMTFSDATAQNEEKFIRKSQNVVWEVVSITGERDSKAVTIKMSFTNVGELDKAIETYLFTVTDNKGNVYRPHLYGETSWLFQPSGYSQAILISEVPMLSTIYLENFSPSAESIAAISLQIRHRLANKTSTPNGQPNSNLLIKNIPIIWQ